MKTNKLFIAAAFIIVFALGVLFGFAIKNAQSSGNPIGLNPITKSCHYNGKNYKSGEGFKATDGCNSCGCEDGKVNCTLMACPGQE